MPAFLGIDFGTSAVRTCLIDETGELLAISHKPLTSSQSPLAIDASNCHITQDPDSWLVALNDCLGDLFSHHPANQVAAVCVDGTSSTVLICGLDGEALTPALMYNDASSEQDLLQLQQQHPEPEISLSITAGLPKILQLSKHVKKKALIQHQADWISGQLCGRFGFSDENNALKTGYDPVNRCWPDWVQAAIPEHLGLPEVVTPGTRIGTASPALQAMGIAADTIVLAGTTDSTAAFIASGVRRMDQGVTTLGSTLVTKQLSPVYIEDMSAGVYSHRLGDVWLTGGASSSGCAVLDQYFTPEQLRTLSNAINPSTASQLAYYPLTRPGERFPSYDPEKQPALSPRPDDDHEFLKGIMEGIGKIEKSAYEKLNRLGVIKAKEIITSGGGSINPVWQTIRQRILEIPVRNATYTEAAYGTARLAQHGTGLWKQFRESL